MTGLASGATATDDNVDCLLHYFGELDSITDTICGDAEAIKHTATETVQSQTSSTSTDQQLLTAIKKNSSSSKVFPTPSKSHDLQRRHLEGSSAPLDSSLALDVGKSAHEHLEKCLVTEVSVLDRDKFDAIPEYEMDQLNIGERLGEGSFSDVFEVTLNASTSIVDERSDSFEVCDERQVIYAMKCLRPQLRSDSEQFINGAEDLVHETALLATLDHPNIISVHGRAGGHLKDAFTLNDGYFILIDRLQKVTLKDCIGDWWRYPEFYLQGPTERQIDIALSIAEAISYLHSKNIVYRDLKPANVGFDSQGNVKIFDFGFAMGLPEENSVDESNPGGLLFDKCGTPRYMAPESGLGVGHRTEADVYSFGILLWEMCSLERPFAEFNNHRDFERAVFTQGVRPSVKKHWPTLLSDMIEKCWSNHPDKRPSMENVKNSLRELKTSLSGGKSGEQRRPRYSRATRHLSNNLGHDYILG